MGTQIEEAALAYTHATEFVIDRRRALEKFKAELDRAGPSIPIVGLRFAVTSELKAALIALLQRDLAAAIDQQAQASQRLDAAAGIKAPAP